MSRIAIALAVLLTACGSSTAPSKAGDPSLLFTNNLPNDYVYVTWQDGEGIIGMDSVAPRTTNQCIRFLAQPDSAKWSVVATEAGQVSRQSYPWFNPANRPAWRVVVSSLAPASPSILTTEVQTAC